MKYAYENLGDEQFEMLIVLLCQKLLGIGVQGFSKGKDGGRDAKFDWTDVDRSYRTFRGFLIGLSLSPIIAFDGSDDSGFHLLRVSPGGSQYCH
jgi:hypothetical protein